MANERISLKFKCPSCGAPFTSIPAMDVATVVVKRTCQNKECREQWQLVVKPFRVNDDIRIDQATLAFLGRAR